MLISFVVVAGGRGWQEAGQGQLEVGCGGVAWRWHAVGIFSGSLPLQEYDGTKHVILGLPVIVFL